MATGWPMKTTYADGDVYAAQDVNDITGTINLLGASVAYAAGKNKIINGDFFWNQRNFTSTTGSIYTVDRWVSINDGVGATYSVQQFTAGTAPVSGYEAKQYMRIVTTGQTSTSTYTLFEQNIESVRTFAGQTATISFWAKAATGTPKIAIEIQQNFGSGGSAGVNTYVSQSTISTSWARYTTTVAVPSISGKTVGTASDYLALNFWVSAGSDLASRTGTLGIQSNTFDIWGVQMENGSTATAFQTATGTIQGELAACQRYYLRVTAANEEPISNQGYFFSSTSFGAMIPHKVEMRVAPTVLDFSQIAVTNINGFYSEATTCTLPRASRFQSVLSAGGLSGGSTGSAYGYLAAFNAGRTGYIGLSAEL
jgi:hypothetical protein